MVARAGWRGGARWALLMNKTSLFASSASHLVALSSLTLLVNSTIVTRDRVVAATSHQAPLTTTMHYRALPCTTQTVFMCKLRMTVRMEY